MLSGLAPLIPKPYMRRGKVGKDVLTKQPLKFTDDIPLKAKPLLFPSTEDLRRQMIALKDDILRRLEDHPLLDEHNHYYLVITIR